MKNNLELQNDVYNAIKWEPTLKDTNIGVTALSGIVTLTGVVDSFAKKLEVEQATKKVIGVKALVEKIEVKVPGSSFKTNAEIAKNALVALETCWSIPANCVTVKVENGWVTLEGELPWNYQKDAAKNVVSALAGIQGIVNHITIRTETQSEIEKKDIEAAIGRNWAIDDSQIHIDVAGNTVTISGVVDTWYQKEEAARIAWNTPGIWHVQNDLKVDYFMNREL